MIYDLLVKLVAEYDHVLHFAGRRFVSQVAIAPDLSLAHKVKTGMVKNSCPLRLCIRAEENRRAKDPLKRCDQPPVLRAALLHAESLQHVGCARKCNRSTLLANGQCSEKDRYKAVLAPRKAITWVAGHLEDKPAVPPLMEQST